jgi:hypothetical protein
MIICRKNGQSARSETAHLPVLEKQGSENGWPVFKTGSRSFVGPYLRPKENGPAHFRPLSLETGMGLFCGPFSAGVSVAMWAVSNEFAKQPPKRLAARFLSRLKPVLQPAYPLWLHRADRMASRPLFQTEGKGGPSFEYSLSLSLLSFRISRKSAARGPRQPL